MFRRTSAFWCFLLLIAAGCRDEPPAAGPAAAGASAQRPPPAVTVTRAIERQVTDYREFTGRTSAVDEVEVRARVSGYLLQSPRSEAASSATVGKSRQVYANTASYQPSENAAEGTASDFQVTISEGEYVTAGTPLFQIDPAPYRLALEQAVGNLRATEAQLQRFELDLQRARDLRQSNAVAEADLDLAAANRAEAAAQVENLRAAVERVRLDLQYTQVVAPIDGLVGQTLVTTGNLIIADQTLLSTIVSQNPIYVYFQVDEQSLLDYRRRVRSGAVRSARDVQIPVQMALANERDFPHTGVIDFVNNRTDPNTGNTTLRASFDNSQASLSPGLFARIRAPFTSPYAAVLVPTRAIAMDQQGRYVMVVGDENTVARRSVQPGSVQGYWIVIEEGLKPGEAVVISGLQKAVDGMKVEPTLVEVGATPDLADPSGAEVTP